MPSTAASTGVPRGAQRSRALQSVHSSCVRLIIARTMPELPDVPVYVEALEKRLLGQPLVKFRLTSPFVLRTFDPPPQALEGKHVRAVRRLGKRIVLEFDGELFFVIHLMID